MIERALEKEPTSLDVAGIRKERLIYGQRPVELPFRLINPFYEGQIRRVYEKDGIVELANSIEENDLLHPLTVVELDVLDAVEYLNDVNELWNTDYSILDLETNENNNYLFLIAGHRRLKAIELLIDRTGLDPEGIKIQCNVRQGIGLTEALKLQFTENASRQETEPSRDALAIEMYFNRRTREYKEAEIGRFSYAQCARELGISPKKVKFAEDYFTLPFNVRESVDAKLYDYKWVLKTVDFHRAIRQAHPDWGEENIGKELLVELACSKDNKFTAVMFEKYLEERTEALLYEDIPLIMSNYASTPSKRLDRAVESLVINGGDKIELALGHLCLMHVYDFREHPVVKRMAKRISDVVAPLIVEET